VLLLEFTNRDTIRTVKVTDMNPLQSFLTNAPVRDTFNPFIPRKSREPDLSDLTPKARNSWQQNKPLQPVHTLEDDKEVFLYQKDRFVFQPSKSLTQQWGNLPEGPLVNPSFPNHPTETFLRPPEGLSLTAKQRPLRNYKKEPGLFELIPGDLPPPVPKEFIGMDTVTERSIRDQRYSDGVPRQGVAMDMATELHRNQGLTQGLGQLLRQFQNMPAAIAGELAPLIPGPVMMAPAAGGSQYSLSQGVPSEMSFGSGISGLFGPDTESIERLAEDVSINAAKDRIVELQNMDKKDFKKNAREIAKLLGVGINLKLDSENDTIKNLQERLTLIERLKEDRAKAQSGAGSRRSSLTSSIGDEKEVSPLAKAQFEAESLRGSLASSIRDEKEVSPLASPQKIGAAEQAIKDMEELKSSVMTSKLEDVFDQAKIRELLKVLQSAGYITDTTDIDTLNNKAAALLYTLAKNTYDKAASPKAASSKAASSKAASSKAASSKAASPKAASPKAGDISGDDDKSSAEPQKNKAPLGRSEEATVIFNVMRSVEGARDYRTDAKKMALAEVFDAIFNPKFWNSTNKEDIKETFKKFNDVFKSPKTTGDIKLLYDRVKFLENEFEAGKYIHPSVLESIKKSPDGKTKAKSRYADLDLSSSPPPPLRTS
jgi:hypothetical protein